MNDKIKAIECKFLKFQSLSDDEIGTFLEEYRLLEVRLEDLRNQLEAAEATIAVIAELPEKWEGSYMTRGANNVEQCATVLRAALNPSPPRS